jgi:hypothetical protein
VSVANFAKKLNSEAKAFSFKANAVELIRITTAYVLATKSVILQS